MEKLVEKNFLKAMEALEDLQKIGGTSFSPLIQQAVHHISEIKREAKSSVNDISSFKKISNFLKDRVDDVLKNYLAKNPTCNQINYSPLREEIELEAWDKILDFLPVFLEFHSQFEFAGAMDVEVNRTRLKTRVLLDKSQDFLALRPRVYSFTKYFLKRNALLSFNMESESDEYIVLSFQLDFETSDDWAFGFNIGDYVVGMTSLLSRFEITKERAQSLTKHVCLEIKENSEVKKLDAIPEEILSENSDKTILHFPFLFRPLSLIIPSRGELIPSDNFMAEDTGSESQSTNQDDGNANQKTFKFLDFFSIVCS